MVAFFKRPAAEDGLDARIALLSRRTQPLADPPNPALGPLAPATPDNKRAMPEITRAAVPNIAFVAVPETGPAAPPQPVPTAVSPNLSEEDRFLLAREELFARLTAELSPERISILSRGELAKVVDAAVQAHFVRNGVESDPIVRRNLITALIKGLLEADNTPANADDGGSRRSSNRSAVETAKAQIQPLVLEHMDVAAAAEMPRAVFEAQLTGWVKDLLTETKIQLNFVEQRELVESLIADMLGLGPLEPLIEDETVTDIMVNGARQVYVERRGKLELTGVRFRDDDHVMNVATKIVTRVGRRIDESTPLVDARLMDGSRVNIIAPPLAIDGPSISIRKFSKKTITLDTMAQQANISPEMATLLKVAARCRLNILISGGTGSGKTTLLNALSRLIDPTERTVTIEDAAELQLQQPHVVRLETRPPNLEGSGEITMRDLLRNALRMRPDRIILGEIRGAEALDVLQAMNTGHDGSMSTIHANAPREALTRLENMVGMTGINLPSKAVRTQIAAAVHLIAQVNRMRDGMSPTSWRWSAWKVTSLPPRNCSPFSSRAKRPTANCAASLSRAGSARIFCRAPNITGSTAPCSRSSEPCPMPLCSSSSLLSPGFEEWVFLWIWRRRSRLPARLVLHWSFASSSMRSAKGLATGASSGVLPGFEIGRKGSFPSSLSPPARWRGSKARRRRLIALPGNGSPAAMCSPTAWLAQGGQSVSGSMR
jgi:pilus assembly protein CpaF